MTHNASILLGGGAILLAVGWFVAKALIGHFMAAWIAHRMAKPRECPHEYEYSDESRQYECAYCGESAPQDVYEAWSDAK